MKSKSYEAVTVWLEKVSVANFPRSLKGWLLFALSKSRLYFELFLQLDQQDIQ